MDTFNYIFKMLIVFSFAGIAGVQAQGPCVGAQGGVDWLIWDDVYQGTMPYLHHVPSFPNGPDQIKPLTELATTSNYKDQYGSLIRGFIKAPETGAYTFNITGDDQCEFYLSTNEDPVNLSLACEVPEWSNIGEHTKFAEQTSIALNWTAGNYYYFEIKHVEGEGGDHVRVHWRLPSGPADPWEVIHGVNLYKNTCLSPCAKAGTACDDGNATTTDDQEDGNCNCAGTPASAPACVGERAKILKMRYDDIDGYGLAQLYAATNYPDTPDQGEYEDKFLGLFPDWTISTDSVGYKIQCLLSVPQTGAYTFNITGANQMSLKLSTDETPANAVEIATTWYAPFENNYYDPLQVSAPITLTAGEFYYMEYTNKRHSGAPFYTVNWKTPFAQDTSYQYLPLTYLYEYACETACLPPGLACDDGDASTFNDQYVNCNCAGTPCLDAACSNSLDYTPYENCAETEQHSTYADDSWSSCQPSISPNAVRGNSHWIQYDLGETYVLESAQVWNYNVAGLTPQGIQDVVVDYSVDGLTWTELGTYTFAEAPGSTTYTGFVMAQFLAVTARYVLFTGLTNFDNSACMGLSEVRFTAEACPAVGTACVDGNPNTLNDTYDIYCNCAGVALVENTCTDPSLTIDDIPVASDNYDAINTVFSAGFVAPGSTVSYIAGDEITLTAGFEVAAGADFLADIISCTPVTLASDPSLINVLSEDWMVIQAQTDRTSQTVTYNLAIGGKIRMELFKLDGTSISVLVDEVVQQGTFEKQIHTVSLEGGIYVLNLTTETTQLSERFVVARKD